MKIVTNKLILSSTSEIRHQHNFVTCITIAKKSMRLLTIGFCDNMTKCFSKVTLADIYWFLKIRSVAFRVCMQQFPHHWCELRYFTRIFIMWLSNSQFLENRFGIIFCRTGIFFMGTKKHVSAHTHEIWLSVMNRFSVITWSYDTWSSWPDNFWQP